MKFVSRIVAVAVAAAAIAAPLGAQTFNYSTRGQFTSTGPAIATCNTGIATVVACGGADASALTLTFTGVGPSVFGYTSGSQISLGTFTPTGSGTATLPPPNITFTLFIDQTFPTVGQTQFSGPITGAFSQGAGGPSFSSLVWSPNELGAVAPVSYDLIFDQGSNGIRIGAEFATTVQAIGTVQTTVPEPGTYALMAAGLAGLAFFARRRRAA